MVLQHRQQVLVDTNFVIEAYRCGCWGGLSQYFKLCTVEQVVTETQTGYQNRKPEEQINEAGLRASCAHVEAVTQDQRAAFHAAHPTAILDPGERDLIVYAGSLPQVGLWLLNSPDMALVKHAFCRGWIDRLVSLESMAQHLGLRLNQPLRDNYTKSWLELKRRKLLLGI